MTSKTCPKCGKSHNFKNYCKPCYNTMQLERNKITGYGIKKEYREHYEQDLKDIDSEIKELIEKYKTP